MRAIAILLAALVEGCGTPEAPVDASAPIDAPRLCRDDRECGDGLFCNGREICAPDSASADALGCAPAAGPPCMETQTCNEAEDVCVTECGVEPDADGDGAPAPSCGGSDCDDADPLRHPAATEICDPDDRDEDCDPSTFGVRDLDADGYPDSACCNATPDGAPRCGDDCDDARAIVHPSEAESCDSLDNDCDGTTDEGASRTFHPDLDRDGYGDAASAGVATCTPPAMHVEDATDCLDDDASIHPGAFDRCNGVDDDCDGEENPDCECVDGTTMPCGLSTTGTCEDGRRLCLGGRYGDCVGAVLPIAESCNGLDDDCNGTGDDGAGYACAHGASQPCATACGPAGTQRCRADCLEWEVCRATEACNGCDDDADGVADDGFTCERGRRYFGCDTACNVDPGCTGPTCARVTGERLCNATCSGYTTLGPSLPECRAAAETCNYCDDDGDGTLYDDAAVARGRSVIASGACADYTTPTASGGVGTPSFPYCTTGNPLTIVAPGCLCGGTINCLWKAGVWVRAPIALGFGAVSLAATLENRPIPEVTCGACDVTERSGFVEYVLTEDGGPDPASAPIMRRGILVRWRFAASASDDVDTLELVRLAADGTSTSIVTVPLPAAVIDFPRVDGSTSPGGPCPSTTSHVVVSYTPDDPSSALNEQRVRVASESGTVVLDRQIPLPAIFGLRTPIRGGVLAETSFGGPWARVITLTDSAGYLDLSADGLCL